MDPTRIVARGEAVRRLCREGLQNPLAVRELTLDLGQNSIAEDGCKALAEKLGGLMQLHILTLYFGSNSVDDDGCKALAEKLGGLTQLHNLN